MKAVLDACVLYPTVLREILTDSAAAGLFQPVWSQRNKNSSQFLVDSSQIS